MANHASKTLVTALLMTITIPSKAEFASNPTSGFYIGAALGGADLTTKNDMNLKGFSGAFPLNQNFSLTSTNKTISGDIFAGYENRFHNFSLGGEVTGSFTSLKSASKLGITAANTQSLETRTTHAFGGSVKLGYYLQPMTKVYLKAGFEVRHFRVNFTDPSNTFVGLNKRYTSTAFVPGFGLEVDLTPRWTMRFQYQVALHPSKQFQALGPANRNTSIQIKPTLHSLTIGILFKI